MLAIIELLTILPESPGFAFELWTSFNYPFQT
jgi:hypothetical protein